MSIIDSREMKLCLFRNSVVFLGIPLSLIFYLILPSQRVFFSMCIFPWSISLTHIYILLSMFFFFNIYLSLIIYIYNKEDSRTLILKPELCSQSKIGAMELNIASVYGITDSCFILYWRKYLI